MNLQKENNELVLRLPLTQKESNCYMDEKDLRDVPNLVGVVREKEKQYSISQSINMSYAGKEDQEGSPYIVFDDKGELEEVCKKFGLDIWEIN
jgi:hypothetical protein